MKNQIYELAEYLQQNHLGKENGISRSALAKKLGIGEIRLKALRRAINESTEIDKLVSTSVSCYMCDTEAECVEAIRNTYKMAVALIKKARAMEKKMGLQGQVSIDKDVVEVFKEAK